LILGSEAFKKKILQNITSKHLALTLNCICFVLDEIPYIKQQVMLNIEQEHHTAQLEADFKKLMEELQGHKKGLIDKLQGILNER